MTPPHPEPHDPDAVAAWLETATLCAAEASAHALRNFSRRGEVVTLKRHDVKLRLDIECQALIEGIVRNRHPDHAFLGEEDTGAPTGVAPTGRVRWVVDPIDGTVNFTHGSPDWACSVAVQVDGQSVAGVVHAPAVGALFRAQRGRGATCNGAPLRVSAVDTLAQALVRTGFDQKISSGQATAAIILRLAETTQRLRVVGSAALDLCRVAAGQADAYFEAGVFEWDIAAGGLIVREAGGAAETLSPTQEPHGVQYLASNGLLQDAMRRLLGVPPANGPGARPA